MRFCCLLPLQVRNLCYMVSRREKLKLSQSKVQEQIFNLHVKLMNQEQAAGSTHQDHRGVLCVILDVNEHLLARDATLRGSERNRDIM